jgi:outer membrane protein assembly factor BamB
VGKPARERAAAAQTQQMPALVPEASEQPRELPPGEWEPPPVRRGAGEVGEAETHVATEPADTHVPRVSKRHAWRLIAVISLLVFGVLGVAGVMIYKYVQQRESRYFEEAKKEYDQHQYGSAAAKFGDLYEKFPTSEHADEYRFLQEWSSLCSGLTDVEGNLGEAADKFDRFLKEHKKDPSMVDMAHDAGQILLKVAKAFAERNANPTDDKPFQDAERIEQARKTVESFGSQALTKAESGQIDAALGKVRVAVGLWSERQKILSQLRTQPNEKPIQAIKRAKIVLRDKEKVSPGFSQDPEVQAAMAKLEEEHFASVVYKPRREAPPPGGPERPEDEAKSLLFAPLIDGAPGSADKDDPIVLALSRGVLYALRRSNGEVRWAKRVGIDTTVLPHLVPASLGSSERLLVMSADTRTLSALNTQGDTLWEYHVGQPVLGRPVIIKQRAYLAAYDGWVHEIELAEGNLVGRYDLGQPLTCGGAHEAGTDRLYFPADDSCVYVLDVARHRCLNILYDGHRSGSLRSEPIVIPPEGGGAPGFLILNQTGGLDAMRLRVFELPLEDRHAAPLALDPPAEIHGWTWFEPYQDGEKMVVLSDAGILGLFGIRQAGNKDNALFPLLKPGGLDLSPFLRPAGEAPASRGRSVVVQVQSDDLWVLAHGRLRQLQLAWNDKSGPVAVPGWEAPRVLGSPLHAPQCIPDRTGRSTFYLVTQPLERQTSLASGVDDTGKILWQRQLGLVCQGEPLALKSPQGGPSLLLVLDQGGGLFTLDATVPADKLRSKSWQSIAPALDDNPRFPVMLLPAPDGQSAYEIAAPGQGKSLVVRHIEWAVGERRLVFTQREITLMPPAGGGPMLPAGMPAVVGAQLIVPMGESYLVRVPLPIPEDKPRFESGPTWRARQAPPNAPGYVLALGGDRFLTTDGARGLAVWEWPMDKPQQPLPETRGDLTLELDYRVVAPPLLLPAKSGSAPQVLVADSAGVLHLLGLADDGSLQRNREWDLKGQFTGGPFLRVLADGVRIGCVLDQRRLVWLDPTRPEPLWSYPIDGEVIVGSPQVIEDMLVLAFQSGRYVGLDLKSGAAKGPGYTLRASVAPAATPVPFSPGLMFTPLSDGTALLLPLKHLRKPKDKN